MEKLEISDLLSVCTKGNCFKFNDKFYIQDHDLAMCKPLSPLLADVFMDHLENRLFASSTVASKHVLYWYRYVDDVICLFNCTHRKLDILLQNLNSLHPAIKFTLEIEDNETLHFLDITIYRSHGKHTFKIYRKPIYTDSIIPADSYHPSSHKMAAFHSMVHRLLNVPMSPINYDEEYDIIKYKRLQPQINR